jgi:hypothetical protein
LVDGNGSKLLSCLFSLDVLCSYVKTEKFVGVMDRCLRCRHFLGFCREMEEEEEAFFEEVERLEKERGGLKRG